MAVDASTLWNEPNDVSHLDFQVDAESPATLAGVDGRAEASAVKGVLGGMSPIDPLSQEMVSIWT